LLSSACAPKGYQVTPPFHNPHLLFRQPIQLIHQLINRSIGGGDFALEAVGFLGGLGIAFVQFEHAFDQGYYAVMLLDFFGVCEVNIRYWQSFNMDFLYFC
jgi:hypothetical protein